MALGGKTIIIQPMNVLVHMTLVTSIRCGSLLKKKKRLFHQAVGMHTFNSSSGEFQPETHRETQKTKVRKIKQKQKTKDKQLFWGLRRKKL